MTTSVIYLDQNQMNESNCKAFKLRRSIKEHILLAVAMRMSAKVYLHTEKKLFNLFPNTGTVKPIIAFRKEIKSYRG